jgi:hypothetical protein
MKDCKKKMLLSQKKKKLWPTKIADLTVVFFRVFQALVILLFDPLTVLYIVFIVFICLIKFL